LLLLIGGGGQLFPLVGVPQQPVELRNFMERVFLTPHELRIFPVLPLAALQSHVFFLLLLHFVDCFDHFLLLGVLGDQV